MTINPVYFSETKKELLWSIQIYQINEFMERFDLLAQLSINYSPKISHVLQITRYINNMRGVILRFNILYKALGSDLIYPIFFKH